MRFEIAAQSIKGGRAYQEDTWTLRGLDNLDLAEPAASAKGVVSQTGALVVVADGMGGEGGGAEASRLVADRFNATFFDAAAAELRPEERLCEALSVANKGLLAAKERGSDLKEKSGSTLIAGILQDEGLHFLSVGDSSILRFRDEEIHRINVLHERAPEMDVRAAELDTEEAWDHVLNDAQRHTITAAVMGFPLEAQHRQIAFRRIQPGDVLVFASDGIETLSFEHMRRAVTTILAKRNVAALASVLVRMAARLGTRDQDNTTVVVVRAVSETQRTRIIPPDGPRANVPRTGALVGPGSAAAARPNGVPQASSAAATRLPAFDTLKLAALAAGAALLLGGYVLLKMLLHDSHTDPGTLPGNAALPPQDAPTPSTTLPAKGSGPKSKTAGAAEKPTSPVPKFGGSPVAGGAQRVQDHCVATDAGWRCARPEPQAEPQPALPKTNSTEERGPDHE